MSSRPDVATRLAIAAAPIACAGYGLAAPDSAIAGGAAWLFAVGASLAGWGHLGARLAERLGAGRGLGDDELDLGLRMAWGTAAYLVVAGVALAAGVLCAHVVLALLAIGLAGGAWRASTIADPRAPARRATAWARAHPHAAVMVAIGAGLAAIGVLAALARVHGNVYDDDVIYSPLVKRLLETGNLDEPFSFRRISAYGGQTVLSALAAARGTLANPFAIDAGLFQVMVLLLLAGLARGRPATSTTAAIPPVDRFVLALVVLVVVLLPQNAINSASYWTGVALFIALYRTLALAARPGLAAPPVLAIAAAVAAAAGTLRQSYLAVAALAVGFALGARLFERAAGAGPIGPRLATAWRAERRVWLCAIVGGAVTLAPWCIATWRSNATFLFPFQLGTFNPGIALTPAVMSAWQELALFIRVALEPEPIRVFTVLVPVIVLARDLRTGRPLPALAAASAIGFAVLIHSFSLSDPPNLWRYGLGYTLALVLVLALEAGRPGVGARPPGEVPVRVPMAGRIAIIVALLIQLALSGPLLKRRFAAIGDDLDAAAAGRSGVASGIARGYAELQASAPADAPIVVMLDEPSYLDYARNQIINLDEPGFASWRPGMPFFRGAEPVATYLLDHGVRYVAFVRGDRSRYMYRRDEWMHRLLVDSELWRIQAAYLIDCVDNLEALSRTRAVRFERDGLVMLDLAVPR